MTTATVRPLREATEGERRRALVELSQIVWADYHHCRDAPDDCIFTRPVLRLLLPPLCAAHLDVETCVREFLAVVDEVDALGSAFADDAELRTAESNREWRLDRMLGRAS